MNKDIIKLVAEETDIPYNDVFNIYRSMWLFIRNTIDKLPLMDNNVDLSNTKYNFNIPSLGKLCTSKDTIDKIKYNYNKKTRGNKL